MTPSRPVISVCAALFLWAALPVAADPFDSEGSSDLGGHGVYLGDGRMLTASPARQLTLRARIGVFDYSPNGEKIAYEGVTVDHGDMSVSIKIVDTWRSDPVEKTIATVEAVDLGDGVPKDMVMLSGWSGDGRYVMVERIGAIDADPAPEESANGAPPAPEEPANGAPPAPETPANGAAPAPEAVPAPPKVKVDYECVDTQGDISSPKIIHADGAVLGVAWPTLAWSPSRARALIFNDAQGSNARGNKTAAGVAVTIYRPEGDARQRIVCPPGYALLGWLDEQSFLMRKPFEKGVKAKYVRYEITGGAETEIPLPDGWYSRPDRYFPHQRLIDPKSPDLTLEVVAGRLRGAAATDGVDASGIWIRRAVSAKKYAATPIGVAPGGNLLPPQWSPAGDAVAFVAHGDLFVTDLSKRDATVREKLDAGDKLDCAEETAMAASNLKEIGLGIIQYTQDNDERMPPVAGFHDAVYPYIKSEDVFTLGNSTFVYHGPNTAPLASISDPASLVLGEMNTPCARIVLYADGHVRAFDK